MGYNDISLFHFYMWNRWCEEECKEVFNGECYQHFWERWCELCKIYDPTSAIPWFYLQLDDKNRDKLVNRAIESYKEHKK